MEKIPAPLPQSPPSRDHLTKSKDILLVLSQLWRQQKPGMLLLRVAWSRPSGKRPLQRALQLQNLFLQVFMDTDDRCLLWARH